MTSKTSGWEKLNPKEKANLLKGNLSYAEHYGYLMDWYLNDRSEGSRIRGRISLVPEDVVKESLHDVLEALKELNAKVEGRVVGYAKPKQKTGLFSRLAVYNA